LTVPVELEINQLIDSLDMQPSNRLSILESCRRAPEDRIVIIHGTDTMVPYAVTNSDAVFNLGCAVPVVSRQK
jgi:L-asparaginase